MTEPTYEEARTQLQAIVSELERGGGNLQELIEKYQEGKRLADICKNYLQDADALVKATVGGEK